MLRHCLDPRYDCRRTELQSRESPHSCDLVSHSNREHPGQTTRLTARLKKPTLRWLHVLDDIAKEAVGFPKEHLPPRTQPEFDLTDCGCCFSHGVAEQRQQFFELQGPDL